MKTQSPTRKMTWTGAADRDQPDRRGGKDGA